MAEQRGEAGAPEPGGALAVEQRRHWEATYTAHPGMYGDRPSAPADHAAGVFREVAARAGATGGPGARPPEVLELGAGHGRDSRWFARQGFAVRAADFSPVGLAQLREAAERDGTAGRITTMTHDVREPLPLPDGSVDGVFAHMLLCMALTTPQIAALVGEVRRVLRPGGAFVWTVRHTGDAHYGAGTGHGDDIWEHGGFAVHYFSRALVDRLAEGWELVECHPFEEGELPRRLWRVTMVRP